MESDARSILQLLLPGVLCYGIVLLSTLTPVWQLMILGGITSGIVAKTRKIHRLSSIIGTFLGWGTYILIKIIGNGSYHTLDMIGQVVTGSGGSAWIFLILILGMGTLLGSLSSTLSYNVKLMILGRNASTKQNNIDKAPVQEGT